MKKAWIVGLIGLVMAGAAVADEAKAPVAPRKGEMLYDAKNEHVAWVYRVQNDGSVSVIIDGTVYTIPANTLKKSDDKLTTSMTKAQVMVQQ